MTQVPEDLLRTTLSDNPRQLFAFPVPH